MSDPRILVIDDSPMVLDMFKTFFEDRAECAPTVTEAWRMLQGDDTLQILFVDLNMRDGGLPFLKQLKKAFPERALIVISGDAAIITPKVMRDVGIFRCIEKGTASIASYEDAVAEASEYVRSTLAA